MQGRVENDMKLKRRVENRLKGEPSILMDYIAFLSDSSWATKRTYANTMAQFCDWLKETKNVDEVTTELLAAIKPMDINNYMSKLVYKTDKDGKMVECSSALRASTWSVLKSFYDFMTVNEITKENVVLKTKRPKIKDTPSSEYLTQAQIKKLIHKVEKSKGDSKSKHYTDEIIIKLLVTTGMRVEPLREINVEDIDFENNTVVTINKGHKTKTYTIMEPVMEIINLWLDERAVIMKQPRNEQTGALLVSPFQTRLSYQYINDRVKYYTSLIGIEGGYSCHKLRHSYGTAVYMITKDINYTKEALGHESITTTQRYINEIDKEMDELVGRKMNLLLE